MITLCKTPFDYLCGIQCIVGTQKCPALDVCPLNKSLISGLFIRYMNCGKRELKNKNQISLAFSDLEQLLRWNISQGFACPICKKTMHLSNGEVDNNMNVYSIEHVKPMGKGGTNTIDNIIICCRQCNNDNNAKNNKGEL